MFSGTAAMTRPVRGGKLLALATTGTKSNGALPDVPSFAEAGLDVEISLFWHAVVAPQGWPKRVASASQARCNSRFWPLFQARTWFSDWPLMASKSPNAARPACSN
jgi:tripartite-type tricarboxylate transporter receptor subunit TctC